MVVASKRIGGAVAGANELGVHISTGLIFGGVLLLTLKGLKRWIVFGSLPLVANTLVLTVSRGAFLGFISAGLAGFFIIPSRLPELLRSAGRARVGSCRDARA